MSSNLRIVTVENHQIGTIYPSKIPRSMKTVKYTKLVVKSLYDV